MPTLLLNHNNHIIPLALSKQATFGELERVAAKAINASSRTIVLRHRPEEVIKGAHDTPLMDLNLHKGMTLTASRGKAISLYLRRSVDVMDVCHTTLRGVTDDKNAKRVTCEADATIVVLKQHIQALLGIPASVQWLVTECGKSVEDAEAVTKATYVLLPSNPDALLVNVITPNSKKKQVTRFVDKKACVSELLQRVSDERGLWFHWLEASCNGVKLQQYESWEEQRVTSGAVVTIKKVVPTLTLDVTIAASVACGEEVKYTAVLPDCRPFAVVDFIEAHQPQFCRMPNAEYTLFFGTMVLPTNAVVAALMSLYVRTTQSTTIPLLLHRRVELFIQLAGGAMCNFAVHPDMTLSQVWEIVICLRDANADPESIAGPCDLYTMSTPKATKLTGENKTMAQLNIHHGAWLSTYLDGSHWEQIMVKLLSGKTIVIQCRPSWTVETLKKMVQEKEGIPPDQQWLIFDGIKLEDHQTLAYYHLSTETIIRLVLRLRGGGPGDYSQFVGGAEYKIDVPAGQKHPRAGGMKQAAGKPVVLEDSESDFEGSDSGSDFE